MALRVKIPLPDEFSFSTTIPVRITDINYGGHVGNDALLGIIHEARLQFLHHFGYSEMNFAGVGLIMTDVMIEFKKETFYGDTLTVSVTASDFSRIGFDIYYRLEKETEHQTTPVAHAKTGMVCYDYDRKKITALPDTSLKKIQ